MAIYQMTSDKLSPLDQTSFSEEDVLEKDLQEILAKQIDVISPETLIIAKEISAWEDSARRIDLLGVEESGNLVVFELKRTTDNDHMELQAIRYAAMISSMTFEKAVNTYTQYLNNVEEKKDFTIADATERLLDFLPTEEGEIKEEEFAQEVRIVLVAADFPIEITSSVLWLNEHGLNIECIRLDPYRDGDKLYLDIQKVIPLPEAESYQTRIQVKAQKEKESRSKRDYTKFDVFANDVSHTNLSKKDAVFWVVYELCNVGVNPEKIQNVGSKSKFNSMRQILKVFEGNLDSKSFKRKLREEKLLNNRKPDMSRHYMANGELIHHNEKTFAVYNGWGAETKEAIDTILQEFSGYGITCKESSTET